jgi:hypothetical protein
MSRDEFARAMVTRRETMFGLLDRIRGVYGNVHVLLETCGADAAVIARLRAATCA